jgi:8-oxo-dGTP diphosphatase
MTSIGTGVFIVKMNNHTLRNEILIGKRSQKCKRAPGIWALPGGMKEDGETIIQSARREVLEETGLYVNIAESGELQTGVIGVMDHFPRENHITVWVLAKYDGGDPIITEPDKCDIWEWREPKWVFQNIPQIGEQPHWTPEEAWKTVLANTGMFPSFR